MEFIEETEICERAVRRLARSRNVAISRQNGDWRYNGIVLSDDEAWSVLSAMPVRNRTRYGLL
jgi:hypothetical protein